MGKIVEKYFNEVTVVISPQGWWVNKEAHVKRYVEEIMDAIRDSKTLSSHYSEIVTSYSYKCVCGEWYDTKDDVKNCQCGDEEQ